MSDCDTGTGKAGEPRIVIRWRILPRARPIVRHALLDIQFPNEARVACDVIIRVTGWEVKIHPRNRSNFVLLKTALASLCVTYQEIDGRFLLTGFGPSLGFTVDLEDVAATVISVLNRLSTEAKQTD